MYRKIFSWMIIAAFIGNSVIPAWAQPVKAPGYQHILHGLPGHREILEITEKFQPPVLRGISVDPENPFRVEFMLDEAETLLSDEEIKQEAERLSKYFLAGLAVPRDELWVNLSPYEADEVVPDELGRTDLGKDLLAEDYVLKQLLASLMHPESEAGRAFWAKVYARAEALYGTSEIPVETCNKVWVVPKKAVVYENGNEAVITESSLEVLLEEDYLAMSEQGVSGAEGMQSFASEVAREVIVPLLEQEVNEGEHFGVLRQIYHSLILASWYKHRLTESVLSRAYADKKKVEGIELNEAGVKERIYGQYVKAFEEGAYDLVKTEYDLQKGVSVSRRYVSGGVTFKPLGAYGAGGGVIAFKDDVAKKVIKQVASGTTRGAMNFFPSDGSSSSAVKLDTTVAVKHILAEKQLDEFTLHDFLRAYGEIDIVQQFTEDPSWPKITARKAERIFRAMLKAGEIAKAEDRAFQEPNYQVTALGRKNLATIYLRRLIVSSRDAILSAVLRGDDSQIVPMEQEIMRMLNKLVPELVDWVENKESLQEVRDVFLSPYSWDFLPMDWGSDEYRLREKRNRIVNQSLEKFKSVIDTHITASLTIRSLDDLIEYTRAGSMQDPHDPFLESHLGTIRDLKTPAKSWDWKGLEKNINKIIDDINEMDKGTIIGEQRARIESKLRGIRNQLPLAASSAVKQRSQKRNLEIVREQMVVVPVDDGENSVTYSLTEMRNILEAMVVFSRSRQYVDPFDIELLVDSSYASGKRPDYSLREIRGILTEKHAHPLNVSIKDRVLLSRAVPLFRSLSAQNKGGIQAGDIGLYKTGESSVPFGTFSLNAQELLEWTQNQLAALRSNERRPEGHGFDTEIFKLRNEVKFIFRKVLRGGQMPPGIL